MARHTSGLTVVIAMVGLVIGLVLLPVEGALTGGGAEAQQPPAAAWIFPVFMVVSAGRQIVAWWARTYTVTEDRLVIDEGVLTRHHRVVPFERVQQVDISRSLGQQVFGLAVLRIATAGEGGATSIDLRYLDRRLANGLRSHVLRRRTELQTERVRRTAASAPPGSPGAEGTHAGEALGSTRPDASSGAFTAVGAPPPPVVPVELAAVGPGRLALAVLTASSVLGAVALALLAGFVVVVAIVRAGDAPAGTVLGGIVVGVSVLASIAAVLMVVTQIVALWDLRVEAVGDDLHLRHGLLDVRHVTVPRARVQVVTVEGNPVQRLLGFGAVTLHSASAGHGADGGATHFRIPHVSAGAMEATVRALLPRTGPVAASEDRDWSLDGLEQRGRVAERRAVVRRAAVGAVVGATGLVTGPGGVLTIVVGGALGWLWGISAHGRAGWSRRGGVVVLAKGALHHRIHIVPLARVQSASTSANPLQRRVGLVVLHVDVAGGRPPVLWDLDRDTATRLQNELPRASSAAR